MTSNLPKPKTFTAAQEEPKFTYWEARLVESCPYAVLVEMLYEKGCEVAANIFEKEILKESLRKQKEPPKIVCQDRVLLMQLFDRAMRAEINWRTQEAPQARKKVIRYMYDMLLYLDGQDEYFKWVYNDCCNYFVKFFKEFQVDTADEILAKVLYRFGLMRWTENGADELVCEALKESLFFCEGQLWASDVAEDQRQLYDLHTGVAVKFAEANVEYGKSLQQPDEIEQGVKFMDEAVKALCKLNLTRIKLKNIYYKTYLAKAQYFISLEKFEDGMSVMKSFRRIIQTDKDDKNFKLVLCRGCELEGICATNLRQFKHAIDALMEGVGTSEQFGYPRVQASLLLYLGIAYFRNSNIPQATQAMKKAMGIYNTLGDRAGATRLKYMMVNLQADAVLPEFLGLIKSPDYSAVTTLLHWALGGIPFWDPQCELELKDYLAIVCPISKIKNDGKFHENVKQIHTKVYNAENEEVQEHIPPDFNVDM